MWEIPPGRFHLSNDVLHHPKWIRWLFTWIITRVNADWETGASQLTSAVVQPPT